eukprot:m51a1_g6490 hypothetical protein (433) ;mRNA; r:161311-163007
MQWFEQRLDQFDPANPRTIKLRYLVNETFWGGPGFPVFVWLGGESAMSPWELSGYYVINEYAQRYRGLMVAIEHRFYGDSMPEGGLTIENMRFLNSLQAIADYASFIDYVLASMKTNASKVVTVGGSYSGSLSAWMRQKYPNLVHAAVASSAPVLAQVDMPEYLHVVEQSLGARCTARVRDAYQKITAHLQTAAGRAELESGYSTCDPISTARFDQATFLESVSGPLTEAVQYNLEMSSISIDKVCDILINSDPDADKAMRNLQKYYNEINNASCLDSTYASQIVELNSTDPLDSNAAMRSWLWQTCVEFGYYQTAEGDTAFSHLIDLDSSLSLCKDLYGVDRSSVFANIDKTNTFYGGRNIATSRVVLPNGSVDPWHTLGVTATSDHNLHPVFIKGTAHCADIMSSKSTDPKALIQARTKIIALLDKWLGY